jgi:hypothetical protein
VNLRIIVVECRDGFDPDMGVCRRDEDWTPPRPAARHPPGHAGPKAAAKPCQCVVLREFELPVGTLELMMQPIGCDTRRPVSRGSAMPSPITLSFSGATTIAYIVRFRPSHTQDAPDGGHSDCIMPSGAPVGYFGTGAVGGTGIVYSHATYLSKRPHYVNLADARALPCVSTLLLLDVGKARAEAFRDAWLAMRAKTDGFTIAGNNCSTHASRACYAAGLISTHEVDGIDTPNNLYDQIVKESPVGWKSYSGYLGFTPIASGTDPLLTPCEVVIDATTVPTTGSPAAAGGASY